MNTFHLMRSYISSSPRFFLLTCCLVAWLFAQAQSGQPATSIDQITLVTGLASSGNSPNDCENCLEAEVPLYFRLDQGSGATAPDYFEACEVIITGHVVGDYAFIEGGCTANPFLGLQAPFGPLDELPDFSSSSSGLLIHKP